MNLKNLKLIIKVAFSLLISFSAFSQKGEQLQHSEEKLMGTVRDGKKVNILIGNVKFTQKSTIIYCDSAFFYRERNAMEAFGNVRIIDEADSIDITAKKLVYEGDLRSAKLRDDVVYRDDSVTLYTDFLDYDMFNNSARYYNGGRIVDGVNELKSEKGLYDTENKLMSFENNVELDNPDYFLECENLVYNILTKKATINSANTITTKENNIKLYAELGSQFDTSRKISQFFSSQIDTRSYTISGERLKSDDLNKIYVADGNVKMVSKKETLIITGEHARHDARTGITKVYGKAVMRKPVGIDTLFMRADTLVSIDDSLDINKRILAYNDVKIYKFNLQGKSDSLSYFMSDSSIIFYDDPVMWNLLTQITSDTIKVDLVNNKIDKMYARNKAFIVAQDSSLNFNQIKGRNMTAFFMEGFIHKVDVLGNGESIYYVLDEKTGKLVGLNHILCSNMRINFVSNELTNIKFFDEVDSDFIPPHEIVEEDKSLSEFDWRDDERIKKQDIFVEEEEEELESPDKQKEDEEFKNIFKRYEQEPATSQKAEKVRSFSAGKGARSDRMKDLRKSQKK